MSKLSKEEFKEYLRSIREVTEGPFEELQKQVEVTNKFPEEFFDLAREHNLYRYALPEEFGGWGFTEKEILQVQEEFSRGPGGMRMHLHYAADLNWRILNDYGCEELRQEYMPKFCDKSVFTNFALTEKTGGTGADLHSTAIKNSEGNYVLNGEKWLISHTDCSQFSYVIAVTDPSKKGDERLSAFFVPMDKPGFELIPMPHMMGCRGAGHAGLRFTNVILEPKYLLGEEGQGMEIAMHSLAISRVHIADSNLGMAQKMLEMSIQRAHDRVTFGKPIAERQAIKMKIANMATVIHALRTMCIDFADDYDRDPHGPCINEKAAMCKLFSIDAVRTVSDEMLEIFGGDGYFEDSPYGPTERLYRDCRALWLEEGAPSVQRITITRDAYKNGGRLLYQDWIAGGDLS
ncbi:acyl-CoA dehydrogenase [Berryella intestinalis]|uniref:Acyl-CoA dehydrogenase n=1 Tax=Berryella intestinalis TaxID=1531429 RepID=A0A0A8B4K6_9ACTN|nr:acyl-CoA dehydrogenase family protein [Berryella intestinalis]AJC12431.1 acyl-CoA dehydrogenase [Berryella intestinalis]